MTCASVLTGVRRGDGLRVVLKAYRGSVEHDQPSPAAHEFHVLKRVQGAGVPSAIELTRAGGSEVLIMERFDGEPLDELKTRWGSIGLESFLQIALGVAESLRRVHGARIVHSGVRLSNILVSPLSLTTCLTGFGRATEPGSSAAEFQRTHVEPLPGLVAPEQTGLLERGVDARTDLYLLGAVLYELLTGKAPFDLEGSASLAQAHLTARPEPPVVVRPDVPRVLSDLILRLLEKDPDSRYQSAYGLIWDLRNCLDRLDSQGRIGGQFALGARDHSGRLRFPVRLYGREGERARLEAACARAADGGVELLILSGPAGVGKSALLLTLREPVVRLHGYMGVGAFDFGGVSSPYAGIAKALSSICNQFLSEEQATFLAWRERLREALGNVGAALAELVPELAAIVEDFPVVPELSAGPARSRLCLALERFVQATTSPGRPLVIVLEDLQRADIGSIFLLQDLMRARGVRNLLVVGTLHGQLAESPEALRAAVSRIAGSIPVDEIQVAPLRLGDIVSMLADVLESPPESLGCIAEQVARKTSGTPLQIQEILTLMWDRGILGYDYESGWRWDDQATQEIEASDTAAGYLVHKFVALAGETRRILCAASLIGDKFELDVLSRVIGGNREQLLEELLRLVEQGLLSPDRAGFRFSHQRLREGSSALLGEAERARLHYAIGADTLSLCLEDSMHPRLFDTVTHLNRGRSQLPEEQRLHVARLNFAAAKRALGAGAPVQACEFCEAGREWLRDEHWQSDRELSFGLYLEGSEAAMRASAFGLALRLLQVLEAREPTQIEFARICVKRIQILGLTRSPEEAASYTLGVLRRLGLRWPKRPSLLRTFLSMWAIRIALARRGHGALLRPARPDDIDWLPAFLVIRAGAAVMSRVDAYLTVLAISFLVRRYLRDGYLTSPGYTLAGLARFELSPLIGRPVRARKYAALAAEWNATHPDPVYGPRADHVICSHVHPFLMARREAAAPADEISERLREIGELEFANYLRFGAAYNRALAGDPVENICAQLSELASEVRHLGVKYPEVGLCHVAFEVIAATDWAPSVLLERLAECDAALKEGVGVGVFYVRTLWMMVLCILGDYSRAFEQSQASFGGLFRSSPQVWMPHYLLYRGLAASEDGRQRSGLGRRRSLRALRHCLRLLRQWARVGPDFAHMICFLEAELSAHHRNVESAARFYAKSVRLSVQANFVHHTALAYERHASLLARCGQQTAAAPLLERARSSYSAWGAGAKIQLLAVESSVTS